MYDGILLTWKRKLFHFIQKQPPEVFYKNISQYSQENTCVGVFMKNYKLENFMKKWLLHRCFPVNIAKFLGTITLKKIRERLLLFIVFL